MKAQKAEQSSSTLGSVEVLDQSYLWDRDRREQDDDANSMIQDSKEQAFIIEDTISAKPRAGRKLDESMITTQSPGDSAPSPHPQQNKNPMQGRNQFTNQWNTEYFQATETKLDFILNKIDEKTQSAGIGAGIYSSFSSFLSTVAGRKNKGKLDLDGQNQLVKNIL